MRDESHANTRISARCRIGEWAHAPSRSPRTQQELWCATRALDSLDLAIAPGEVYCLLGPNGAGKTTTINLFLGFVAPTAGQALIAGLDVSTHDRETKQRIAYIPEQVMLYRNLNGLENLEYFAALGGRGSLTPERLTDILAGLRRAPPCPPGTLSE